MSQYKNIGYEPSEIKMLQKECKEAGQSFIYFDDEDIDVDAGEMVHVQFVGKHNGQTMICDAVVYTLRLHHGSLVYERALEQTKAVFPHYLSPEEREADYKVDEEIEEEAELMIAELIEAIEEDEEIKVSEHIEIDAEFEYGLGIEVCLNVDEITDEIVEKFIKDFNNNTLKLDNGLYSFMTEEEE